MTNGLLTKLTVASRAYNRAHRSMVLAARANAHPVAQAARQKTMFLAARLLGDAKAAYDHYISTGEVK